jgi:hypothetical protein
VQAELECSRPFCGCSRLLEALSGNRTASSRPIPPILVFDHFSEFIFLFLYHIHFFEENENPTLQSSLQISSRLIFGLLSDQSEKNKQSEMRKAAVPTIRRATVHAKEEGRFYTVAGHSELFPSVTTILGVINKPQLHLWTKSRILSFVRKRLNFLREESTTTGRISITEEWVEETIKEAEEQPNVEADVAAQFGTASHNIIENVIKGQEQEVAPKYAVVVENYNNWLAQSGLEIKETEKFIWSETYALTIARAHNTTRTKHGTARHAHTTAHAHSVQTQIRRIVGRLGPVHGAGRPPAGGRGRLEGAHTLVVCVRVSCVVCRVSVAPA